MAWHCSNCNTRNESYLKRCEKCNTPIPDERKDTKPKAVVTGNLSVSPKILEITELRRSEIKETYILLTRSDFENDKFSGVVECPQIPGVSIKSNKFDGLRNVVNIQIDAKKMEIGTLHEGMIRVQSTIGDATIPVRLQISTDSPQLGVDYEQVQINMNMKETSAMVNLANVGCGVLMGTINTKAPWITLDTNSFSLSKDDTMDLKISLNKKELKFIDEDKKSMDAIVNIETNAGNQEIKVIIYLIPPKSLKDLTRPITFIVLGIAVIVLLIGVTPYIRKFLLPKAIRNTGLWGIFMSENGRMKMAEFKWNPFKEPEKLIYTAINAREGQVCEAKITNKVTITNIAPISKDRLYTPACSPDGFFFAFGIPIPNATTDKGKDKFINMSVTNENKSEITTLTQYMATDPVLNIAFEPSFSPDGLKLAFVKTSSPNAFHGEIWVVEYDNADPYLVSELSSQNIKILGKSPKWSPKGKQILVEDLNKEIFIIEPKGRKEAPVITKVTSKNDCAAISPRWLPDPNIPGMVFCRDENKESKDISDIYTMTFDKNVPKCVIKRPDFEDDNPDCSPNGKFIAFDSFEYGDDENIDIYMIGINGKGLKNLTDTKDVKEKSPLWSPDGKKISYLSYDGKDWELYIMKPFEKSIEKYQITNDELDQSVPIWWSPLYFDIQQKLLGKTKKG
jgi:Tol biopolymer transport system component